MASYLTVLYFFGVLITLIGALFGLFTFYIAYVRWKYRRLPSPKIPSFYAGHLSDILRMSKTEDDAMVATVNYWLQDVKSHTFIVFLISKPELITVDPEVIKEIVMNKKNGRTMRVITTLYSIYGERFAGNGLASARTYEMWKPQRKLFDPAFSKLYLKSLVPSFAEITNSALEELKPLADGNTKVPMKKHILKLATDIISHVAFSTNFSKIWTAQALGLDMPKDCMHKSVMSAYPSLSQYMHPIDARKYRKYIKALRKIGRECIMKRIKMIQNEEELPKDILTLMLTGERENIGIEDLVDNFITFYFAGQDTTASTIMFTLLLLLEHPNAFERVVQEIDDVIGNRSDITGEDTDKLQYLEQVVCESLRLYPPAFGVLRNLHSENKLGGHVIPAGTDVMIMVSNMFRMPEHYENPDNFDPDRFHPDKQRPSSFVYCPFGLGHRSCIGRHFATIEVKVVLARMLKTFSFHFPDDYKIQAVERASLQPKDDLLCTLTLKE